MNCQEQDYAVSTADLHFREAATSQAVSLQVIPEGDTIRILDTTHILWREAEYKGNIGYVSKNFIEEFQVAHVESEPVPIDDSVVAENETGSISTVIILYLSFLVIATFLYFTGKKRKSRLTTTLIAATTGGLGMHRFYLGQTGYGFLLLAFSWTFIPMVIGFIDALIFLLMNNEKFNDKYNRAYRAPSNRSTHAVNSVRKTTQTYITSSNAEVVTDYYLNSFPKLKMKSPRNPVVISPSQINLPQTSLQNEIQKRKARSIPNNNFKKSIGTNPSPTVEKKDDNIIDVSLENLNREIPIQQNTVPYWPNFYVYRLNDLSDANKAQRTFYYKYREEFLNGNLLNINGNTNYAFVLHFDLLDAFRHHKDIKRLYRELQLLGQSCAKTKSYNRRALLMELQKRDDSYSRELYDTLRDPFLSFQEGFSTDEPFKNALVQQYKDQLSLNQEQMVWLSRFYVQANAFIGIEGCRVSIVKHFLLLLEYLKKDFDFNVEIKRIISKSNSNDSYGWGSTNTIGERFFQTLFRRTENQVREAYGYNRRISEDFSVVSQVAIQEFEERVGEKAKDIFETIFSQIIQPGKETELELNRIQVTRWKKDFDRYKKLLNQGDLEGFLLGIQELEELNSKNTSIEQIMFDASKSVAKVDKPAALDFYARYVFYDLGSSKVNDKDLPKEIKKHLFTTNKQLLKFEEIIDELKADKNLDKALGKLKIFYVPNRKRIVLNQERIQEERKKHESTVEILNQYLMDEPQKDGDSSKGAIPQGERFTASEGSSTRIQRDSQTSDASETTDNEVETLPATEDSLFLKGLSLPQVQQKLLIKLKENGCSLPQVEVGELALQHGLLKNQLIDSVNEVCLDFLDGEVLIEEDGDNYIMEKSFYNELLKQ